MKKISPIVWFVALVLLLPLIAYGIYDFYQNRFLPLPVLGRREEINGEKAEHHIAAFSLVNQDAVQTGLESWDGKIVVANFFFTRCPSICPKMMNNLKTVEDVFKNDDEIRINSFTVDPEHDSTAQLKKYAGRFGIDTRHWDLLTGDKKEIYRLARNSFLVTADDGDGGPADFIHSDKLVLTDKKKRIRGYYDGTDEKAINHLIHDIKKLKHEK